MERFYPHRFHAVSNMNTATQRLRVGQKWYFKRDHDCTKKFSVHLFSSTLPLTYPREILTTVCCITGAFCSANSCSRPLFIITTLELTRTRAATMRKSDICLHAGVVTTWSVLHVPQGHVSGESSTISLPLPRGYAVRRRKAKKIFPVTSRAWSAGSGAGCSKAS